MKDKDAREDIVALGNRAGSAEARIDRLIKNLADHKNTIEDSLINITSRLYAIEQRFVKKCKSCGQEISEHDAA